MKGASKNSKNGPWIDRPLLQTQTLVMKFLRTKAPPKPRPLPEGIDLWHWPWDEHEHLVNLVLNFTWPKTQTLLIINDNDILWWLWFIFIYVPSYSIHMCVCQHLLSVSQFPTFHPSNSPQNNDTNSRRSACCWRARPLPHLSGPPTWPVETGSKLSSVLVDKG